MSKNCYNESRKEFKGPRESTPSGAVKSGAKIGATSEKSSIKTKMS